MNSFQSTKDPEYSYLINKKVELTKSFLTMRAGFRLVQEKKLAFHCEANTAFPLIRNTFTPSQICDLNVLPFRREKLQALVIRRNSPFHDIFAIK